MWEVVYIFVLALGVSKIGGGFWGWRGLGPPGGGCAPRRAFCDADVPEGARSDPSGLGAEMLPPERCVGISPVAMGDQGAALDLQP